MEQGFKLVPNTCNWIDADGNDAGAYPVEEAYGVSKYRIEYGALDATPTRRRFLAVAAAASAVSVSALAAAALPTPAHQCDAAADDGRLLKLEEQIFEQYEAAGQYDAEILRLSEIWTTESDRLYKEALSREVQTGTYLTPQERWKLVTDTPACIEHNRMSELQEPFLRRMDDLISQMFAIRATTSEGRRAKAEVLLTCVMPIDWRHRDEETDRPELMARNLLLEFVDGIGGEALRAQFA